jgi:hypothetical protein
MKPTHIERLNELTKLVYVDRASVSPAAMWQLTDLQRERIEELEDARRAAIRETLEWAEQNRFHGKLHKPYFVQYMRYDQIMPSGCELPDVIAAWNKDHPDERIDP